MNSLVNHLGVLDDAVIAIGIPVDVQCRTCEGGNDVGVHSPRCEGASVAAAVLRQARGVERYLRVQAIPLVRTPGMNIILLAQVVVVHIKGATVTLLGVVYILIEAGRDANYLLYLVEPRRVGMMLGGGDLPQRIREEYAVHVPPGSYAYRPRFGGIVVAMGDDGLE